MVLRRIDVARDPTHVGAQRSEGGRGIVALRSTTKKNKSKIVFELLPGAKVSISRNDVDT
ncbi:MAG: hypothetical protein HXY30_15530, partial [Pseudorhodoplanes sp.]|nr:hypothetical protein [Pseudorhodoplanes sp.]